MRHTHHLLAATALLLLPSVGRAGRGADELVPVLQSRRVSDGIGTTKGGRTSLPFQRQVPGQGHRAGRVIR